MGPLAVAVIFAMVGIPSAAGGSPPQPEPHVGGVDPEPAAAVPSNSALHTPSFVVSTGDGAVFSLDEHIGEVVVLYFYFSFLS